MWKNSNYLLINLLYNINMIKIIRITDEQITNPNDELYDLQKKYNVKISRSNSSKAVYIFRQRNYVVRIGHRMTREQMKNHIPCKVYVWVNKPTKEIVEDVIKKYFK